MTARALVRRALVLAVACGAVALGVGCGVPEGAAEPIPAEELPESLRSPVPTTSSALSPGQAASVAVYWVRDRRLVAEAVTFDSAPDPSRLIDLLESGPGSASTGVRSAVSGPGVLAAVAVDEPSVEVDVGSTFDELTASEQMLAVAQVVATLTTVPGVQEVSLLREGEVVDVPLPDGTLVRRPLVRADYASLFA